MNFNIADFLENVPELKLTLWSQEAYKYLNIDGVKDYPVGSRRIIMRDLENDTQYLYDELGHYVHPDTDISDINITLFPSYEYDWDVTGITNFWMNHELFETIVYYKQPITNKKFTCIIADDGLYYWDKDGDHLNLIPWNDIHNEQYSYINNISFAPKVQADAFLNLLKISEYDFDYQIGRIIEGKIDWKGIVNEPEDDTKYKFDWDALFKKIKEFWTEDMMAAMVQRLVNEHGYQLNEAMGIINVLSNTNKPTTAKDFLRDRYKRLTEAKEFVKHYENKSLGEVNEIVE